MDYDLARHRGLMPLHKVADMRPDDIGFFENFREFDEILQDHGWKRTDYSVLKLSVYMLDGCDAEILVKEEALVSLKLFDSATHAVISEGTAPLSECMMIGGSLIVGAGVEV